MENNAAQRAASKRNFSGKTDWGKSSLFWHSERSEESLFDRNSGKEREILRFAQNDKINYLFRSLLKPCPTTNSEVAGSPAIDNFAVNSAAAELRVGGAPGIGVRYRW